MGMKQINKKHTDALLNKAKRRFSPEMYSVIKELVDYILIENQNRLELDRRLRKIEEALADEGK